MLSDFFAEHPILDVLVSMLFLVTLFVSLVTAVGALCYYLPELIYPTLLFPGAL